MKEILIEYGNQFSDVIQVNNYANVENENENE